MNVKNRTELFGVDGGKGQELPQVERWGHSPKNKKQANPQTWKSVLNRYIVTLKKKNNQQNTLEKTKNGFNICVKIPSAHC